MCSVVYALDLYSCVYMYEVITVKKRNSPLQSVCFMLTLRLAQTRSQVLFKGSLLHGVIHLEIQVTN